MTKFNQEFDYPFQLRQIDFQSSIQDLYDFLHDVNESLTVRGLKRLEDMMRSAATSGIFSDFLTASIAQHSRVLTENRFHNGHPDLITAGVFPDDKVKSGDAVHGIEVKTTVKTGGAVDTHGARDQWLLVFVYKADRVSEPASVRDPTKITEVYLSHVETNDFRRNERSVLGTRTATLHAQGLAYLREHWIYLDRD